MAKPREELHPPGTHAVDKKKQIKLGIVIAGLVGAVTITLLTNLSDSAADAEDSSTLWKCTACLKTFDLTARKAARAQRTAGGVPILCPLCDKVRAYQVMACPKCGTLFFGSEVPNHNGQCPVCVQAAKQAKKKQNSPIEQNAEAQPPDAEPEATDGNPQNNSSITRAVMIVPVVEELFWRGFILRAFVNWDRFDQVPLGRFTWMAFLGSSLLSVVQHPGNWGVSMVCWMLFNGLFYWRKSLLCLMITHGVTNLALYWYVVRTGDWQFW